MKTQMIALYNIANCYNVWDLYFSILNFWFLITEVTSDYGSDAGSEKHGGQACSNCATGSKDYSDRQSEWIIF